MIKYIHNRITIAVLIFSMVFGATLPTLAQENTETPQPEETNTLVEANNDTIILDDFVADDSPEGELLNAILEAIATVVYLPAAAGIVTVGTSFLKRLFTQIPAKFIALTLMIILWALYSLATGLGYETQLNEILDAITQIGFILLGATGTAIVSTKVYEQAARANVPLVGYSRHVAEYQRRAQQADG